VVTVFESRTGGRGWLQPGTGASAATNPFAMSGGQQFLSGTPNYAPETLAHGRGAPLSLDTSFVNVPPEIRELRFRADAGFGYDPVFRETGGTSRGLRGSGPFDDSLKRLLPGLRYAAANACWIAAKASSAPRAGGKPVASCGALCDRGR